MFLGIDLGTSGVKALLVDHGDRVVAEASAPLDVQRPRPLWSEQDPDEWWRATDEAVARLGERVPGALGGLEAIGLSGQMHGATLLGDDDRPLRPAILWNDGRSAAECDELERRVPASRKITGNLAMPGFTAPKLVWLAEHEPEVFSRVSHVLLPKDYLRLRLCGERAADLSDASGTLWLDVAERCWSDTMLAATGLSQRAMPRLVEGSDVTGVLRRELADRWGLADNVVIAGGAGDQAAGAIAAGVIDAGQAFLALGTSGVTFVAGDTFQPDPEQAVHAFCHALPDRWHQMSVILSAASCLPWLVSLTGARDEAQLLAEVERGTREPSGALFLPYLSGERTPHNDPDARGVFFGLTHESDRAELARAVLEGVAFALADGQRALVDAGAHIERLAVLGGGARSRVWGEILASVLGCPLDYAAGAEVGPAFGAARLARLAATGESPAIVCRPPAVAHTIEPDPEQVAHYRQRFALYRKLYTELRQSFRALA